MPSLQLTAMSPTQMDLRTKAFTNFSRLRLSIEKQEGKRKYKSDGGVMVGEFVCVCMYVHAQGEWVGE